MLRVHFFIFFTIKQRGLSVRLALQHFNGEKTEQHTLTITCIPLPYPFIDWTAGVGGGGGVIVHALILHH